MRTFALALVLALSHHACAVPVQDAGNGDTLEPRLLPEHEALQRRHVVIEQRLTTQAPIGIKKMTGDPTEKFFPEYWVFENAEDEAAAATDAAIEQEGELQLAHGSTHLLRHRSTGSGNYSFEHKLQPPLLLHSNEMSLFSFRALARELSRRGYQCPSGYNSCSSIGYNDTCCASGQTCQVITNTGIGVVGCCPGTSCSGSVSSCNTAQGYSSCPNSANPNGCCSPGFICDNVGCVESSVSTVSTTVSQTVIQTTIQTIGVTTQTITSTQVITPSDPSTVYVTHTTPTGTVIVSAQGQSTATTVVVTTITGTIASAPVRPTSGTETLTTITSVTSSAVNSLCPTGYYACSAFYLGGCCQVGQNCDSTHCPSPVSATIVSNSVVTIVVETGFGITTISEGTAASTTTTTTGSASVAGLTSTTTTTTDSSQETGSVVCPTGWFTCGSDAGGGCCPTGYGCAATCSATQSGFPKSVAKIPSTGAGMVSAPGLGYGLVCFAGILGFGMHWL